MYHSSLKHPELVPSLKCAPCSRRKVFPGVKELQAVLPCKLPVSTVTMGALGWVQALSCSLSAATHGQSCMTCVVSTTEKWFWSYSS